MNDAQLQTLEQVRDFIKGSQLIEYRGYTTLDKYSWTEEALKKIPLSKVKEGRKRLD